MRVNLIVDKYYDEGVAGLKARLKEHGLELSQRKYDITIFVGGDGTFADNAIKFIEKPVLLISKRTDGANGSVGYNSAAELKDLGIVAEKLAKGSFYIKKEPILIAEYNGRKYRSVYDFFVERQKTKEALRYSISVFDGKTLLESDAVSNGFIITTPIGSTGYYSYPNLIMGSKRHKISGMGLCHILPVRISDFVQGKKLRPKIQRVFSGKSAVTAMISREAGQMLFGMPGSSGMPIKAGKKIKFYFDRHSYLKLIRFR